MQDLTPFVTFGPPAMKNIVSALSMLGALTIMIYSPATALPEVSFSKALTNTSTSAYVL